MLTCFIARRPS